MRGRLLLDAVLACLMLCAFAYPLSGNRLHEIAGTAFLVLAVSHNVLARRWYGGVRKGRMRPVRAVSIGLNLLLLATALLLIASGVTNSQDLFAFLRPRVDILDHRVHSWAAYWMLVLASLHLGLNWPVLASQVRRLSGAAAESGLGRSAWRIAAAALVLFGVYAFFERDLPLRLAGLYAFDDWDPARSSAGFFLRYVAIISVGVCLMRLGMRRLRRLQDRRERAVAYRGRGTDRAPGPRLERDDVGRTRPKV